MKPRTILVVDDETQIRVLLRATLVRAGYGVVEAATARAALASLDIDKPEAVLLDLGLPDRDGLELLPLIRAKTQAPVLVISARGETEQKVAALDLGANDYVTKPFDTEELLARVRSALRQGEAREGIALPIVAGDVSIDLHAREIRRGGAEVHLTPREYGVVAELAKHPGRIVTHAALLTNVWGPGYRDNIEYLRVVMRNLRLKLEADASRPVLLVNELGVGYRLRVPEMASR
ncbi:response regulator [Glacieibacterium frigidum]|uniref:Response regulator transcription factor n=1 Tax=Glacieibacterium frigidum TaxID=2593303 RepID=A0A552UIC2_9SPHN|nr:response regulator transcription factor [Glacieibacterium frigidum]TRW17940.1 response regulator transcription factor [Glacieibacterium frigidum]